MSQTADKPAAANAAQSARTDVLRVSAYDNASSGIISLLFVIGFCVLVMLAIWFSMRSNNRPETPPIAAAEVKLPTDGDGREEGGQSFDFVEPLEPPPTDRFDNLSDVIALKRETFENFDFASGGTGTGRGQGNGSGTGTGEKQPVWEIRFSANSLDLYAKQLDFFEFELAAVGGGNPQIDYLSKLSAQPPMRRVGTGAEETRPYFTWKRGSALANNDRLLMAKSGIVLEKRIILQYYPEKVYQRLAQLEKAAAKGKRADKTIFGVVPVGDGFEFKVDEQVLSGP